MLLMEALIHERKSLVLTLVRQTQNVARVCITILIIVICLLAEKKSLSLKSIIKNVNFPTQFCQGSLMPFVKEVFSLMDLEMSEMSTIFSGDYNATDKSDILNIHKYLMVKNYMK